MAESIPRGRVIPNLRRWREHALLTQKELAEQAGVSRPTLVRAEQGEPISMLNIRRLAGALEVKPDQLLYEVPGPTVASAPPDASTVRRRAVIYMCALTPEEFHNKRLMDWQYQACASLAQRAGYTPIDAYFSVLFSPVGLQTPRPLVRHLLEDIRDHEYDAVVAFSPIHLSGDPDVRSEIAAQCKQADIELLFVQS